MNARLDWSGDKRRNPKAVNHWNGGRRLSCRLCGMPALLCDDDQRPCHKVCAESERNRLHNEGR